MAIGRDDVERRPDRRVGKTRKALKEALTDLILEKGYESVTVQDVIDRADVGRSTFYAHFVDKDDLLMAILADLEMPGLDPTSWKADDPAFGWTLALFRHFGSGKRLFKAVAGGQSGSLARRETTRRLEELTEAELSRLKVPGNSTRSGSRRSSASWWGRSSGSWIGGCARRTITCLPSRSTMLFARSSCPEWRRSSSWSSNCRSRSRPRGPGHEAGIKMPSARLGLGGGKFLARPNHRPPGGIWTPDRSDRPAISRPSERLRSTARRVNVDAVDPVEDRRARDGDRVRRRARQDGRTGASRLAEHEQCGRRSHRSASQTNAGVSVEACGVVLVRRRVRP